MRRRFSAVLLLAAGMAAGQTGSTGAAAQGQNPQSGQPGTSSLNPIQQTLRGCLKQSGDSWTLSQSGQDTALAGDPATMKPHDGQQVEVQGTQPIGGTLQVTSVITISRACLGQSSSTGTTKPAPSFDSSGTQPANQSSTTGKSSTSSKPAQSPSPPDANRQTAPPAQPQPSAGSGSDAQPSTKPPI